MSAMDDYAVLSDTELAAVLRQYNIPHGPIVGMLQPVVLRTSRSPAFPRSSLSVLPTSSFPQVPSPCSLVLLGCSARTP